AQCIVSARHRYVCSHDYIYNTHPSASQNDASLQLLNHLNVIHFLPSAVRRIRDPHVSWWPSGLKGNLDTGRIRSEGFDLYEVERPANAVMTDVLLFAVDWSKGRGFFYRTSGSNE